MDCTGNNFDYSAQADCNTDPDPSVDYLDCSDHVGCLASGVFCAASNAIPDTEDIGFVPYNSLNDCATEGLPDFKTMLSWMGQMGIEISHRYKALCANTARVASRYNGSLVADQLLPQDTGSDVLCVTIPASAMVTGTQYCLVITSGLSVNFQGQDGVNDIVTDIIVRDSGNNTINTSANLVQTSLNGDFWESVSPSLSSTITADGSDYEVCLRAWESVPGNKNGVMFATNTDLHVTVIPC